LKSPLKGIIFAIADPTKREFAELVQKQLLKKNSDGLKVANQLPARCQYLPFRKRANAARNGPPRIPYRSRALGF
jgi:hypothetical protein